MSRVLDPFRFVLIAVAGWMNQCQLQVVAYLREENRVLREQLGSRPLRLLTTSVVVGRQGQGIGKEASPRGGHDCHARDVARLAPETGRGEIPRSGKRRPRKADDIDSLVGAHGRGEPGLGVLAHSGRPF